MLAKINILQLRIVAFALSAFLVVGEGSLGVLATEAFYLEMPFVTRAILVVRGIQSLAGALLGTMLITNPSGRAAAERGRLPVNSYMIAIDRQDAM